MTTDGVSWASLFLSVLALAVNVRAAIRDPRRSRRNLADIRWGVRRAMIENNGGWVGQSWRPRFYERRAYKRTRAQRVAAWNSNAEDGD